MAIIPSDERFIGLSQSVDLKERRSARINAQSESYTMQDISDTVTAGITPGISSNPSETFIPLNEGDEFIDSPIYALKPEGFDGYSVLGTKVNYVSSFPAGGIASSNDFGLEINGYYGPTRQSSVSIGDYAQTRYGGLGEFYWYTGSPLTVDSSGQPPILDPFGSGINFSTYGYNLFESTYGYFKLDAKNGNASRVDGLLYNIYGSFMGFGEGLDVNARSLAGAGITWDLFLGDVNINGASGQNVFYSSPNILQTYMSQGSSKLGINFGSMYVSDDIVLTASPTTSTKVLKVLDASGNSYRIKLYNP